MLNKHVLVCFALLLFVSLFSHHKIAKIDSLKKQLAKAEGVNKARILIKLASTIKKENPNLGIEYAQEAQELLGNKKIVYEHYSSTNQLGHCHRFLQNHYKSIDFHTKALYLSKQLKLKFEEAEELTNIAHNFWYLADYSKAMKNYNQAMLIFEELDSKNRIAKTYNNIGNIYVKIGKYDLAIENLLKSLAIKQELNDEIEISSTLNNLGNLYIRLSEYDLALDYYQRSAVLKEKHNKIRSLAMILNNIGNVYLEKEDYESSLLYYNRALLISQEKDNKKSIATTLNNIGVVYENKGNYLKALEYYEEALDFKTKVNDVYGIANVQKNIGDLFLILNDHKRAYEYLMKSLKTAKEINAKIIIMENYKFISEYYEKINDFNSALKYEKQFIETEKEILNEQIELKVVELEMSFKLDEMKRENDNFAKDNEIYKLRLAKNNVQNVMLILAVVVIGMIVFMLIMFYSAKRKKNIILEKSNKELEICVSSRTVELENSNKELSTEIVNRRVAEKKIIASLEEKDVLLREIHHRVRNNLQVISSILDLQSEEISGDDQLSALFRITQNRIRSMLLVHEKLYISKDYSEVNFKDYIKTLVTNLFDSYSVDTSRIKPILEIADIPINLNIAVSCGMIINELITNSLKYAFPDNREGYVKVLLEKMNGDFLLEVCNNGVDFPMEIDFEGLETVGLQVVSLLANQINASITIEKKNGVKYIFHIK